MPKRSGSETIRIDYTESDKSIPHSRKGMQHPAGRLLACPWPTPQPHRQWGRFDMKIDGLYMRNSPGASAEISIATVGGNTCQVTGEALWGEGREFGPNMGGLNFAARVNNRTVIHSEISASHSY